MDTMIKEINESLKLIIDGLAERQEKSTKSLNDVEDKIAEKIEEAKQYKTEVENTKAKIKSLETEIANLEVDLSDLNERFGKKDFSAIVEAGNREINAKIMDKQNQITKHRQKIAELTEKARNIKDLLINLRKDKATKEERLNILTKSYNYYSESLNKIIDFAKENPESLDTYVTYTQPYTFEYTEEDTKAGTAVFEEIESMNEDEIEEASEETSDEGKKELTPDPEEEDLSALDDIYEKLKAKNFQFSEIDNKNLDKQYEDIFGESSEPVLSITEEELNSPVEKINEEVKEEKAVADIVPEIISQPEVKDFTFALNPELTPEAQPSIPEIETSPEPVQSAADLVSEVPINPPAPIENIMAESNTDQDIINFFQANKLEFNNFSDQDKLHLKNNFNADNFKKTLGVLIQNHLDLNKVYAAATILTDIAPEELDKCIGKLLLANQTTENIEYVLSELPSVTSNALNDVVAAYGGGINDANIIDIINKARDMNDKKGPVIPNISYLTALGFAPDEVNNLINTLPATALENLTLYPKIVTVNYNALNKFNVSNIKAAFNGYSQSFLVNPDRFTAMLDKYDPADLVRCIEKNPAVIEKL